MPTRKKNINLDKSRNKVKNKNISKKKRKIKRTSVNTKKKYKSKKQIGGSGSASLFLKKKKSAPILITTDEKEGPVKRNLELKKAIVEYLRKYRIYPYKRPEPWLREAERSLPRPIELNIQHDFNKIANEFLNEIQQSSTTNKPSIKINNIMKNYPNLSLEDVVKGHIDMVRRRYTTLSMNQRRAKLPPYLDIKYYNNNSGYNISNNGMSQKDRQESRFRKTRRRKRAKHNSYIQNSVV